MTPLRIRVRGEHPLGRAARGARLAAERGGAAGGGGGGQEGVGRIPECKPDIALIDISMPGLNGLEVAARIGHAHPTTRVIIVSMHGDDETGRGARVAGAAGYMLKNSDRSELELALRTVARGDTWLSPSLTKRVVQALTQGGQSATRSEEHTS